MAKTKLIAGIELGSSKVATLISQVTVDPVTFETSVNIVGAATSPSKGVKKGQIVDIEETVEAAISSVEAAERMAGYNLDTSYIALSGAHVASQNSHGVVAVSDPEGEISIEDVDRVIEAASAVSLPSSREVVHVVPREFIVDGESGVRDAVGMSGVRLEVDTHIIHASSAAVKNLKKAVAEVGIEIEGLIFSGVASAEAVTTSTEKELGCCVIDIGGGVTAIAAYSDGALSYSGVIPIGAKNITNDLAIGLRVSLESAEKIKIFLSEADKKAKKAKAGEEADQMDLESLGIPEVKRVSKKTLSEGIIRPRLNEIFTMVRIELEKAVLSSSIPSGAIITGGGAETVEVIDSARRMLSLPVRIGLPRGIGGLTDDVINPAFSTCTGLILWGARQEPQAGLSGIGKRFKLPTKGIAGRLIQAVKNLLP
ncbi:cell division protein FtsA [Candidatus Woesebacteria bacterium GWA1_41_8]|uniref:Cell division protein FtsA n=1 Tax=Candidatus Woesebacteria bacterium GWA1_41_8 TaxID=1802471 RepID=A0A1F7WGA9_9BACT|nr:MAG: cell division protein FtsA [Candidatus Woesebacteria bacterium GWA1_41_8]